MWRKHTYREQPKKSTSIPLLPIALGIVVICLLVIQVLVSNRLATSGSTIDQVESQIGEISQTNSALEEKIASYSAFTTLKIRAEALGFIKPVTPVYLSPDLPVALDTH